MRWRGKGGCKGRREGCEGANKAYLLVTLISYTQHTLPLLFCSLPFTATLLSHSFPNHSFPSLSNN